MNISPTFMLVLWTAGKHLTSYCIRVFEMHICLFESDIDNTTVLAFNMLSISTCQVVSIIWGKYSEWFHIRQGTRQGGKTSQMLYILFINGLNRQMEKTGPEMCMCNMSVGYPTVARRYDRCCRRILTMDLMQC